MRRSLLLALPLLLACTSPDGGDPCPEWVLGGEVDSEGCGQLAVLPGSWGGDLYVVRVQGSPQEMGYQYGRLTGLLIEDLWWTYMDDLAAEAGMNDGAAMDQLLGSLMDTAWGWYEPHVPPRYLEELDAVAEGMDDAGVDHPDVDKLPRRFITLIDLAMSSQLDVGNLGGLGDFLSHGLSEDLRAFYGMDEELPMDPEVEELMADFVAADLQSERILPGLHCSYYAAWGERTDDGGLYATRNMDFTSDTGIADWASVAVFVPDEGVPYASISWLGANLGALAGISAEGITVSAVGASSPLERLDTEPALFKARDVLGSSTSLDDAVAYMDNTAADGINRAPTIGYNALVTWGDPRGGGADAGAAIVENNGLSAGVFRHHSDCSVDPFLVRYDAAGAATVHTPESWPQLVNHEGDAAEIDAEAAVRLFAHDGTDYVLVDGHYVEDPEGVPIQTGYPEDCALYRGDEALAYGVRMHQSACHGPVHGGDGLMIEGGSYRERYTPMHEMTLAYAGGQPWSWQGEQVIADAGGSTVPIGMDEAEAISRVAAMRENTWDVVYDATDLVVRLSFESGRGEEWTPADEQPPFMELDLADLFLLPEEE